MRVGTFYSIFAVLSTFLLLLPQTSAAQEVSVEASVNATEIGDQETLTLTVTINGSDGSGVFTPDPPETEGLALTQRTPGTRRNVSIVNGRVTQSFGFTWMLRPVAEGRARILPMEVVVAGETYRTEPIDINVVPQSQRPAQQPRVRDPFSAFQPPNPGPEPTPTPSERDIYIQVVPASASVWQHEQLVLEYRLFFREGIQLRQSRLTDSWDANGFWREEMEVDTRPVPRTVVRNGLRYNVITLKRAAVFPTRSGSLTIDPLRIESEAMLPFGRRDPFQSLFSMRSRFAPIELASPEVSITARPLPDGAPNDFSGAVGSYRLEAGLNRTRVATGDGITLRVSIRGEGNLATLGAPAVDLPASLEVLGPTSSVELDRSGNRVSGTKVFEWVLIPRARGSYTIPPVTFSWFNPETAQYRTDSSDAFTITAEGSPAGTTSPRTVQNGLPVGDVAPPLLHTGRWRDVRARRPLHERPLTWILLVVPLLLWGGTWITEEQRKRFAIDEARTRQRLAHPVSRKHLARTSELLDSDEVASFYEELDRALTGFIGNQLNVSETGLTRKQLADLLLDHGVSGTETDRIISFLEVCDRGRFAPAGHTDADRKEALSDASTLIVMLNGRWSS